jgi:hypothetical protein
LSWWIIIIVLLVALSPLWQFAPSRQQRHIARLRESAALAGLFVEFRELPPGARLPAEQGRPIYYGRRLPPARRGEPRSGCWVRDGDEWRGAQRYLQVPPALAELPSSVAVAGIDNGSCGVYWQEGGSEADVAEIAGVLEAWSAAPAPIDH